jgi:DNA adenine methylase
MSRTPLGRYPSPLRYPGGKGKIANYIKLIMLQNGFVGRDYVEPYAGGASVALTLLYEDYADHIHINDLNSGIYAFWTSVLDHTDDLCTLIQRTPVNVTNWRRQRRIQKDPTSTTLALGFSTFFLNRANRSGIISGGVIGGQRQAGPWKIDARYNTEELVRRVRKVARYRSRISVTNIDAVKFLSAWQCPGPHPAFLYLDPPYYLKGSDLYDNYYGNDDHRRVAETVSALAYPWIVSYDAVPEIVALYRDFPKVRYSLSYSAATVSKGSEIMFFDSSIRIPQLGCHQPAGLSTTAFQTVRSDIC